jgi:hypothetical protein
MHDFPIWLKLIIWLSIGSVVVYTAANILISAFKLGPRCFHNRVR